MCSKIPQLCGDYRSSENFNSSVEQHISLFFSPQFFVASVLSLGLASAAPQVPLAAAPLALPLAPNCKVEDVVIETQACTPRSETVCNTIDVNHQHVEYEQICEDVTST